MRLKVKYLAGTAAVCLFATGAPALAQAQTDAKAATTGELETIVVTAERRAADVQKTAASISVRSGEELMQQGKTQIQNILEDVPGVTYTGNGASGTQPGGPDLAATNITIRGIQSNSNVAGSWISAAPAAALYVDDVYEGLGDNYDIDRVEVLRGPQGTLYGRSATSGVVAIHTGQPDTGEMSANLSTEFGNHALEHFSGSVNVPIVQDQLAVRVAADSYRRDGYFSAKGGRVDFTNLKVKALYTPTDNLSILIGYASEDNSANSGGVTQEVAQPNPDDLILIHGDPIGHATTHAKQYWANINWNMGFATLTSITALREFKVSSPNSVITQGGSLSAQVQNFIPHDQYITQEVRLTSTSDGPLTWQVGALYYGNDIRNSEQVNLIAPITGFAFASHVKKDTIADGVFAEATYSFDPTWHLTGGLRYDYTRVATQEVYTSMTGATSTLTGPAGVRKFDNITYKARLEHNLSADNMLYASVSSGFSPGDVSITTGLSGNPSPVVLRAETLTAYEIGSKNRFLDNRLQINGDIYFYDYAGYQTDGINISGNPVNLSFATLASPVKVWGAELEGQYLITPEDRLTGSAALSDPRYVKPSAFFKTFVAKSMVAHAVPLTITMAYSHTFELANGSAFVVRGQGRYLSPHDAGNLTADQVADGSGPLVWQPGVLIGDFDATWMSQSGRYSATAYVRNVANQWYKNDAVVDSNTLAGVTANDPRTYGVVLSAHF